MTLGIVFALAALAKRYPVRLALSLFVVANVDHSALLRAIF